MNLHLHTKYPVLPLPHTHLECTLLSPPQRSCRSLQGDFQSGVCLFIMRMKLMSNWGWGRAQLLKTRFGTSPENQHLISFSLSGVQGCYSSPSLPSLSREVPPNQEEGDQFWVERIQDGAEPICLEKFGNK